MSREHPEGSMSNSEDKARQQPLTPNEQLHNLVEGLCEEPFELVSDEDKLAAEEPFGAKPQLLAHAYDIVRENFGQSLVTEVYESFPESRARMQKSSASPSDETVKPASAGPQIVSAHEEQHDAAKNRKSS
jgi:hypothetical protein